MLLSAKVASLAIALLLAAPTVCRGQSIVEPTVANSTQAWPSPVRTAQHIEADPSFDPIPVNPLRPPLHPHHVIKSPTQQRTEQDRVPGRHGHGRRRVHVPNHLSHHVPLQSSHAKLPRANLRDTWKSPYSYGYFGASGTRHWSLHHGYRDRYTEWRLR